MSIGIANAQYNSEFATGITNPAYDNFNMNGFEITGLPTNPATLTSNADAISVGATIQRLGTYSARNMYCISGNLLVPTVSFNMTANRPTTPTFTVEPVQPNTTEPVGTPHSLIYLYPNYDNDITTAVYPRQTLKISGRIRTNSSIPNTEISVDAVPFLFRQTGLPPYTRLYTYPVISHSMTQGYIDATDSQHYLAFNIEIVLPIDQVAYTTVGALNIFKSLGIDFYLYGQGQSGCQLTPQSTDTLCLDFVYIASPFLYT
jgi:hypothetical protein